MSQKMINQKTRTTDRSFPRISLFLDNLEEGGVQRGVVNLARGFLDRGLNFMVHSLRGCKV